MPTINSESCGGRHPTIRRAENASLPAGHEKASSFRDEIALTTTSNWRCIMNKPLASIMLMAALLFAGPLTRSVRAEPQASVEMFYSSLGSYGEWVDLADYGYCWHPTGVGPGW